MSSNLRCINCSFLNFATAGVCKRCGAPFDSAAGNEWASQPYAQPEAPPQPSENGSYYWDQPSYRPNYAPPPAPTRSIGGALTRILIIVAVIGMVSYLAIPMLLKSRKTDFSKVSWTEYKAPDGKFSVSLPASPKITPMNVPTPFGNASAQQLDASVSKDGGCMLMYADYPVERMNVTQESIYDMALKGAERRQTTMSISARRYVSHDGLSGMEVDLKPTNPKLSAAGAMRVFWVSPRLYVIAAGGPDTAEFKAVQKKCFESFKINRSR
jgi:hypothetical protein